MKIEQAKEERPKSMECAKLLAICCRANSFMVIMLATHLQMAKIHTAAELCPNDLASKWLLCLFSPLDSSRQKEAKAL